MVPDGWSNKRLDELASIQRGKFSIRPRNDPRYYGGDMPFIQTGDVARAGIYLSDHSQTLNEKGISVSKVFPLGTILITIAANIGDTAILTFPAACPDSLVAILPHEGVTDTYWLNLVIASKKVQLDSLAPKNAQKNINLETLKPLRLLTPQLFEQRKIAQILSTWDKAITTTEQLLANSKQQKKALMQKLLTGKRRTSEFGEPWSTVKLSSLCDIRRGASPRPIKDTKWFSEKGRGWVRISDVTKQRGPHLLSTTQYLSVLGSENSVPVEPGELIMSICATIGVPKFVGIPVCVHDGFVVFRNPSEKLSLKFLFHFLTFITARLSSSGQPGTQKNLNTGLVGGIDLPSISIQEQDEIAKLLTTADLEVENFADQVHSLRDEKKALMQQLLTGKLRAITE